MSLCIWLTVVLNGPYYDTSDLESILKAKLISPTPTHITCNVMILVIVLLLSRCGLFVKPHPLSHPKDLNMTRLLFKVITLQYCTSVYTVRYQIAEESHIKAEN